MHNLNFVENNYSSSASHKKRTTIGSKYMVNTSPIDHYKKFGGFRLFTFKFIEFHKFYMVDLVINMFETNLSWEFELDI